MGLRLFDVLLSSADEFDEMLSDNRTAFLRNIADELRQRLPLDAMLPSENAAYCKVPVKCSTVVVS